MICSRTISSISAAGLVFVFLSPVTPTCAQQVKVMQWNVLKGLGRQSNNTNAQAKALARIVNFNQPDVLLFNEIDEQSVALNEAAIIDWVTNNVPYLGKQSGVTFFVRVSTVDDAFNRNGAVSRYPVLASASFDDGLRGLHSLRLRLSSTNELQVYHAHLKCCSDEPSDCTVRQANATFASGIIRSWAATNSLPYIFAGDWNEDEANPSGGCPLSSTYRPITMIRTNGNLVEFIPTALNGDTKTYSSTSPFKRYDYCLAGSNRLSAVTGHVFNSSVWGAQYTSANPSNSTSDSTTASDHLSVFVTYSFPTSVTNFSVTPTNAFASGGPAGGAFSPLSQIYTLTNSDAIPLFWSVTKTTSWVTVSTLATNFTLGAGQSTNITVSINSAAELLTPNTYTDVIKFSNTATGVTISRGVSLEVGASPPTANFSGSPTNGTDPLEVTFTDTSTGNINDRYWDFGDGETTNVTTNVVSHTYAAGTYDVTLIASGVGGAGTNVQPNYVTVWPVSTLTVFAADLEDQFGDLMPTSGVAALVADTGGNGFTDPQPAYPVSLGAAWGADDKVVGLWDLKDSYDNFWGQPGGLADETVVVYTNGLAEDQTLRLYWFPDLTLASNTVGVTYYGKYSDTNAAPLDGSAPWSLPASTSAIDLIFLTESQFGSNPDAAGQATYLTTTALTDFENWQIQYFGGTNNPAAAASADPDGDGQNNEAEFLAGIDPTNSASSFRIKSIVPEGNNLRITWTMGSGRTNAAQFSPGTAGNYNTNFNDVFTVTNTVGTLTNFLHLGAATNTPAGYYRIRLVP